MDSTTMSSKSMAPGDVFSVVQQALLSSKQLQSSVAALDSLPQPDPVTLLQDGCWANIVQAHTNNVIAHTAIIDHLSTGFVNEPEAATYLEMMAIAAAEMVKNAQKVQEHVMELQVDVQQGRVKIAPMAKGAAQPAPPTTSQYQAPSVEDLDSDRDQSQSASTAGASAASNPPAARTVKSLKRRKGVDKLSAHQKSSSSEAEASGANGTSQGSPKRHLEAKDIPETQALLKRTKLSPKVLQVDKRKSDISMVDAELIDSSPLPASKRHKPDSEAGIQYPNAPAEEEYEDISAEVDARLQQHEARKEHERKKELGIIDKRKRQSNDSFTAELHGMNEGNQIEKREKKRKKRRHSGHKAASN